MGLLDGRVALVTGAGRGIGSAVARLFAAEGAAVIVHYNSSRPAAEQIAKDIGATAVQADLMIRADAERLARTAIDLHGRLDILVNNAASFAHGTSFVDDSWGSYAAELDGVLGTTFHITRAVAPQMSAAGYGRIINFGATLLKRPAAGYGPHIVAKAAVEGLTRTLARELGPHGVTVNIIHPGMTRTDYTNSLADSARDAIAAKTPLRRIAGADDVARVALFFASDLSGFITGAGLAPDGGLAVL